MRFLFGELEGHHMAVNEKHSILVWDFIAVFVTV